jgi:hypothetical protein
MKVLRGYCRTYFLENYRMPCYCVIAIKDQGLPNVWFKYHGNYNMVAKTDTEIKGIEDSRSSS